MTDRDGYVAALLDEVAPAGAPRSSGWEAIVREADPGRVKRRRLVAGIPAAGALAAAVLVLVLAWPFGETKGGVLDRALAAVGNGPVLHVVLRGEWGGKLVDLRTGVRSDVFGETEIWYDADRNLIKHVSRLGQTVQDQEVYRSKKPPADVLGLATEYRRALQTGSARIASEGEVEGIPVDWIKVRSEMLPDVADNRLHEWAQEVAISKETYEPVATRETRDGSTIEGSRQRLLKMEGLPAGSVNLVEPAPSPLDGKLVAFSPGFGDQLSRGAADAVLSGRLLWAGRAFQGLPLARVGKLEWKWGLISGQRRWKHEIDGVLLAYGDLKAVEPGGPRFDGPSVLIRQALQIPLGGGPGGFGTYVPPEGSVLLRSGSAVLRRDGVDVEIQAPDEETALAAARALEPMPASAGSGARR